MFCTSKFVSARVFAFRENRDETVLAGSLFENIAAL
jgi:hypothetical protein